VLSQPRGSAKRVLGGAKITKGDYKSSAGRARDAKKSNAPFGLLARYGNSDLPERARLAAIAFCAEPEVKEGAAKPPLRNRDG